MLKVFFFFLKKVLKNLGNTSLKKGKLDKQQGGFAVGLGTFYENLPPKLKNN